MRETTREKTTIAVQAAEEAGKIRILIDYTVSSALLDTPEMVRFKNVWSRNNQIIAREISKFPARRRRI